MADKPTFEPTNNQLTRAWALDQSRKAIAGGTGAGFGGLVGGTSAPVKNVGNLIQLAEWLIDGLGTDEAEAADEAQTSNPFDDPFIHARDAILKAQMSIGNKLLVAADFDGLLELDDDARAALFEEARQSLDALPAALEAHRGQHEFAHALRDVLQGIFATDGDDAQGEEAQPAADEPVADGYDSWAAADVEHAPATPPFAEEEEAKHEDEVQRDVAAQPEDEAK